MVVVRMVLDRGDDDNKKKVVGSWFVLLQVCTIGCAVQSCYVTIFALTQTESLGEQRLQSLPAYTSRARLFLKTNRRDRPSNTSCGLGFRGLQKKEIRDFEVKF